jgi:outer membrane protein OmpA-like peptidoglycan-associated protein/tetratricopeptide (TPR) repeat protein
MNKKVILLSLVALLVNLSFLSAQTNAKLDVEINRARADFRSFKYSAVINRLEKIIAKDSADIQGLDMLAYSYKMTNNYPEALKRYEQLSKEQTIKPDWALNFAEQLAIDQQYERSENWYRRYLRLIPADQRAKNILRENPTLLLQEKKNWKIGYTNLNTLGAEYSPTYYNQGLIFSSNRQSGKYVKHIFEWDNTPFTNLFVVDNLNRIKSVNPDSVNTKVSTEVRRKSKINDDDSAPTSNDTRTLGQYAAGTTHLNTTDLSYNSKLSRLLGGKVNSRYNNSSAAIFPDGSIIFTRNNYIKGQTQKSTEGIIKLKLYQASGPDLDRISEFSYNSNEYSVGHPALNSTGNVLIFASDMPGGYGGTDLYFSVRSGKGAWTRPMNLGRKINTEGNELFPYLDKAGTLYFSSTGHAGFGGLDIFSVLLKEMKPIGSPKNIGAPINSSTDDFGLIISDDDKSGFFSSNRKGNDDIYQFNRSSNVITLQGIVFNAITKVPLMNTRILMRRLGGIDTLLTGADGHYQRQLPPNQEYELTAHQNGYVNKISFVSSIDIYGDSIIKHDIYLDRIETAQQYVVDHCDSLKKIFIVKNIYYNLDKAEIRSDAKPALNDLAKLMTKYPEMSIITSSHTDSRATERYNRSLSARRGEAAKAYLISKGISAKRINIEYYGKTRLINRCYEGVVCSEEDQQLNRRTEFDVVLSGVNLSRLNCEDK